MDWFTSSSSSRPVKTVEFYQRKVVSFLFSAEGRDGKDLYLDRNEMKAILFTKFFDYILITCFLPHCLDAYGKFNLIRRIFCTDFRCLNIPLSPLGFYSPLHFIGCIPLEMSEPFKNDKLFLGKLSGFSRSHSHLLSNLKDTRTI